MHYSKLLFEVVILLKFFLYLLGWAIPYAHRSCGHFCLKMDTIVLKSLKLYSSSCTSHTSCLLPPPPPCAVWWLCSTMIIRCNRLRGALLKILVWTYRPVLRIRSKCPDLVPDPAKCNTKCLKFTGKNARKQFNDAILHGINL